MKWMTWDWKKWAIAALIRAVKTFAQTFAGCIVVGAAVNEVEWLRAASVSFVAFAASVFTSLAGIPEVETKPPAEPETEK